MAGDWKEGEKGEGGLGRDGRDALLSLFPIALFSLSPPPPLFAPAKQASQSERAIA